MDFFLTQLTRSPDVGRASRLVSDVSKFLSALFALHNTGFILITGSQDHKRAASNP